MALDYEGAVRAGAMAAGRLHRRPGVDEADPGHDR